MTGKAIDIDQSLAAWWLRSLRLSVYCWRGVGAGIARAVWRRIWRKGN